MELIQVTDEIYTASQRLSKAADALYELAREKAEAERRYRLALAQEMLRLKADGLQVTLITDVAKGSEEVADKLFKRDLSDGRFRAGLESQEAIKTQISAYQTILKYRSEV
ncbi:hypothetical protein FLT15_17900 [Paenibacillus thiaminolyticus]|uniref:hypothetical protein n=1 Tax=Paenibacillus thiaminolyticus TaxID=49283 RepID=UPI001163C7D1|nr:hypothetical protein [Paenibacillus thiaminolyticus]NGP60016.1 hypothetical protein [Paenibacillus thiaminolyticus]NGP60093.1 hypothetical protein [Paenibacillus thiaminolyticus]NGP60129.1 hypothetical protein [Paenibacillus thiaminolyticus]